MIKNSFVSIILLIIFCFNCIQIVSSQTVKQSKYWEEKNNVISNTSTTYIRNTTDWGYRMSYYSTGNKIEYFDMRPACCQSTVKYFDGKTNFDYAFTNNTIHRFNFEKGKLKNPLKAFYIQLGSNRQRFEIQGDYIPENFYIQFGCFKGNTGCITSVDDGNLPTMRTAKPWVLYSVGVDAEVCIRYWKITADGKTPPYFYIDGTKDQTAKYIIYADYYKGKNYYDPVMYAATGRITSIAYYFDSDTLPWSMENVYMYKAVCTRAINGINYRRFMAFKSGDTANRNNQKCTCTPKSGTMTKTASSFDFPDCGYNSTLFDLDLSKISETSIISPEMTWNSIIFKSNQEYTFTVNNNGSITTLQHGIVDNITLIVKNGSIHFKSLEINSRFEGKE